MVRVSLEFHMVDSLYVLIERNGYPSRGQAPEIYATRLNLTTVRQGIGDKLKSKNDNDQSF